jgi:hypothetical protein
MKLHARFITMTAGLRIGSLSREWMTVRKEDLDQNGGEVSADWTRSWEQAVKCSMQVIQYPPAHFVVPARPGPGWQPGRSPG